MSLLDPKIIQIGTYDGEGKSRSEFSTWRDTLENFLQTIFPLIKKVMIKMRHESDDIDETKFESVLEAANLNPRALSWDYEKAQFELGVFLKIKLKGEALKAVRHTDNGLEMYRLLHLEYDKQSASTQGILSADLLKFVSGPARNLKDLKKKLVEFHAQIQEYEKKIDKPPDMGLCGSILTNMLDLTTKREFLAETKHTSVEIIGDYKKMRSRILELTAELVNDPMDIGALDNAKGVDNTKNEDPKPEGAEGPALAPFVAQNGTGQAQGKRINPDLDCWNCGKKGHPSFLCPEPQNPAAVSRSNQYQSGKGQSKGGGYGNKGGGKFGAKGGSKGYQGGYGKGKGKGLNSFDEWGSDSWSWHDPSTGVLLCTLDEVPQTLTNQNPIMPPPIPDPEFTRGRSRTKNLRAMFSQPCAGCPSEDCHSEQDITSDIHTGVDESIQDDLIFTQEDDTIYCCPDQSCQRCVEDNEPEEWGSKLTPEELRELVGPDGEQFGPDPIERIQMLGTFDIREKPQINTIGEWESVEFTVDSGAAESVVPSSSLTSVSTEQGEKSRRGVEYESACGTSIPNEGEKVCRISTDDAPTEKIAVLQVANIGKSLLSVSRMVDKGNVVVFAPNGSYIYNQTTRESTWLRRKGNLYVMDAWVRSANNQPTGRPSSVFNRPGR